MIEVQGDMSLVDDLISGHVLALGRFRAHAESSYSRHVEFR